MEKPNNMNTEIENLNKALLKTIEALKLFNCPSLTMVAMLNDAQNLLKPTQPEGYQGLNKWYLSNHGHIFYAVENSFVMDKLILGYGLNSKYNEWSDKITVLDIHVKSLATESEIIEAIKKGLEQKGIVAGARVKSLVDGKITLLESNEVFADFYFDADDNEFYFRECLVFDNGTFAEVVKEEKPTDSLNIKDIVAQKHGYADFAQIEMTDLERSEKTEIERTILYQCVKEFELKDSSDKELLKGCYDYLFYVKRKSFLFSQEVVLDVLLARINEVIKPN